MEQIRLHALAKINLGLDVVRRKEDGYHEVRMIMQTINLYDRIHIRKIRKPGISIKTNLYYLPVNENNLVFKAAKLLMDEFEIKQGVTINLNKFIPVAAGMAGGSSDAAAVLYGMNKIFRLGLSTQELMDRGVRIGADVPYCIIRGTVLAEGIGEILTPLAPMSRCMILIAKPGISVSTKFVYGNLKVNELTEHPDIDELIRCIESRNLNGIAANMGNVLETVTIPEYPVIEKLKQQMIQLGALNAMMSGSGPTVFGIFNDTQKARHAYHRIKAAPIAKQVYLTSIFNNRR